jgi:uncharacterized protein YdeI (BOF family)
MRRVMTRIAASVIFVLAFVTSIAAQEGALVPRPRAVTVAELGHVEALDGQLVQLNGVVVRHTDTAQVFTFGDKEGPEIHVIIPTPAIDGANVGDTVAVLGTVRKFAAKDFERDYQWFRQADYPHLSAGTWLIVARSVRTTEGTELVPGGKVSEMPRK